MMNIVDREWDGEIDILINNAGLITKLAAEDEDEQFSSWMDTMQVNLNAPYSFLNSRMKE
jgi:glucose 1-dehydrogenase